jgi:hypothetical protein
MPTVIVSYRRSDSRWITGRIVDRLERDLGKGDVFVDIDAIPVGMDFRDHLRNVLERCDVLLAIIGPQWLATDEAGRRRIFEPSDWVRIEIETALAKGIPVIPVLIDRAPMPNVADLPESMHAFAFRQAADVDSGRDFHVHMDRLVRAISQSAAAPVVVPEHASGIAAMETDAPRLVPAPDQPRAASRHRGVIAAVVAAAAVAATAVLLTQPLTQSWSDRPAVVAAGPPAQRNAEQVVPDLPAIPPAADPASTPDEPASAEPPLSLNPPVREASLPPEFQAPQAPSDRPSDQPLPSDRPVPPLPIDEPQRQRALLFEEDQPESAGRQFNGNVTWRTVKMSSSPGQLPALVARADIVIPDRQLAMTLSLRANTDPNLPASHTIEIVFKLPAGFAPGGISNVPAVLMKESDDVRGAALVGTSAQLLRPGVFLIGLSGSNADRARNIVPIVYDDGTRAILTVGKGPSGDHVFKQVFAAWRE